MIFLQQASKTTNVTSDVFSDVDVTAWEIKLPQKGTFLKSTKEKASVSTH